MTRSLHDLELATVTGSVDSEQMLAEATELADRRRSTVGIWRSEPQLTVVVVPAPRQQIIRPSQMQDSELARYIKQELLFGPETIFRSETGTQTTPRTDGLEFSQEDRALDLRASGTMVLRMPPRRATDRSEISAIIEEDIRDRIGRCLQFSARLLDHLDPVRRLTHFAPVVGLDGAGYMAWRTRAEHERSPRSGAMGSGRDGLRAHLEPVARPRAVLGQQAPDIAADLTALLRQAAQS